jgi:tRNA threonylcarbamoyladenosine biosynthesis protein TsaE
VITRSEEETAAFARELAGTLTAGDVVLLSGGLGAGKTAFVRGLAAGLGIAPEDVSSPTFTLLHEYRGGRLPLYHADLYRLEGNAAEELGLEQTDGVLAIEWPDRLTHDLRGAMAVDIEWIDDTSRRINVTRPQTERPKTKDQRPETEDRRLRHD